MNLKNKHNSVPSGGSNFFLKIDFKSRDFSADFGILGKKITKWFMTEIQLSKTGRWLYGKKFFKLFGHGSAFSRKFFLLTNLE